MRYSPILSSFLAFLSEQALNIPLRTPRLMLSGIRGMINLREDVDILNTNFMVNKKLVEELALEYKEEITKLKEIKQYQTEFLADFKNNVLTLHQVKQAMERELEGLRTIKFDVQREMLKRFEKEINDLFNSFKKELTLDKEAYARVKQQIEAAAQNLFILHGEVAKLMDVSRRIKKEDFELVQHQEMLLKADHHKVELMKKIDELETICARLKRGGQH